MMEAVLIVDRAVLMHNCQVKDGSADILQIETDRLWSKQMSSPKNMSEIFMS